MSAYKPTTSSSSRRVRAARQNQNRYAAGCVRSVARIEPLEGRLLMSTGTFGNPSPINIPSDPSNVPTPASIYGSGATVRDLTGPISNVRVTLNTLTHTAPEDLDILLVSPSGTAVILMSDAGGPRARAG